MGGKAVTITSSLLSNDESIQFVIAGGTTIMQPYCLLQYCLFVCACVCVGVGGCCCHRDSFLPAQPVMVVIIQFVVVSGSVQQTFLLPFDITGTNVGTTVLTI